MMMHYGKGHAKLGTKLHVHQHSLITNMVYGKVNAKSRTEMNGHEFKIMNTALNRSMLLVKARRLYLPHLLKCGANILFALLQGVVYMQQTGEMPDMIIKVMTWRR